MKMTAVLLVVQVGLQIEKQVEISEDAQRVLKDKFPDVPKGFDVQFMPVIECHADVCTITFPCQGTSQAGPRTGMALTGDTVKVILNLHDNNVTFLPLFVLHYMLVGHP
jgi:site-specific DNA-cytosine methylase